MGGIGIVGTGISGLQLALYLQHKGVDTTVYSPRSVEEHRTGRLPNCVMRWAPTVDRERELGVYRREANVVGAVHVRVAAAHPLAFCGHLAGPANTTDFRLYLPDLLEDYQSRGGRLVVGGVGSADLDTLGRGHDLVVVANGRDGFGGVFPRDPARSPHQTPPRHITAGLYHGVGWPDPAGVEFTIVPGLGEIFQVSFHSFDGPISAVAVEGIPGGPLAKLAELDYDQDPPAFEGALLDILQTYAPTLAERVDHSTFGLARPVDLLQGRLTPVVRQAWSPAGRRDVRHGDRRRLDSHRSHRRPGSEPGVALCIHPRRGDQRRWSIRGALLPRDRGLALASGRGTDHSVQRPSRTTGRAGDRPPRPG